MFGFVLFFSKILPPWGGQPEKSFSKVLPGPRRGSMQNFLEIHREVWPPNPNKQTDTDRHLTFIGKYDVFQ